ncbi:MAG: hypothetical protein HRU38_05425 [Saccharospirillaceae bacterium]|nr:hypothetical protein [Pseudomonadales bacterium]NRB78097.1 hypothetical protein [Saccharospirillaceae bacterium]
MKSIISLILLFVSINSFAQSELFENEDSIYYNSIGVGLNVEGVRLNELSAFGLGFDINAGYLINKSIFTNIQFSNVYSLFENNAGAGYSNKQAFGFQLGVKKTNKVIDPFVLTEVKFNFYDENSIKRNWQSINTQFGIRAKINAFESLKIGSSAAILIGGINLDGDTQLVAGVNLDLDVIIKNKIKAFLDFEFSGGSEVRSDTSGYLAVQASVGLKYIY